ncbi:TMEM165/GDT1 family protein [Halorientalis regularis]|uniref:Putative Ca2+/H+ antiporter, TMEM165/GDT1 family n=1 Tax=Halorientalis regularis TaxID=660518 RepID=A0A1G7F7Z1_9EURY|nr:TMEM165/GDT1 family protein [Halorientalis regularis]SDE72027.1 Putative Ca2+/H+ antiporter, TMEM165/GDT1 family [Halorientalis regularis]
MTGFFEIMVVAMATQLAVLPGEKVQFLISGLSTRYNPLVVVSAAGTAFAGWTALEIWFGQAIKGALPEVYLSAITAALFLFFAVALWRSAPSPDAQPMGTDGSGVNAVEGYELPVIGTVPTTLGSFLPIFSMMAVGEFGDKTQLVTIGLAIQYGAHPAIWVGEMLAIIPVSIANAVFFYRFSHRFDLRKAHFFGAGLFAFFGLDTVLSITVGFSVWEQVVQTVSTAVISLL